MASFAFPVKLRWRSWINEWAFFNVRHNYAKKEQAVLYYTGIGQDLTWKGWREKMSLITLIKIHILSNFQGHLSTNEEERSKKMRELILSTEFLFEVSCRSQSKFATVHKIRLWPFWGPDVLWRSDFDVINASPNFNRLLLNYFSK